MSLISDIFDFGKSVIFISDTLKDLEVENDQRDLALKTLNSDIVELDKRLVKLETARDSDLARIEAAIAQLSAQRSQLDADVERHIAQIQRTNPQLPPAQPTDN